MQALLIGLLAIATALLFSIPDKPDRAEPRPSPVKVRKHASDRDR